MLRAKGVVGRFVEFYGPGLDALERRRPRDHRQHGARIWRDLRLLPDRRADARISAPDRPRRGADRAGPRPIARRRACGATTPAPEPVFTDTLELDMSTSSRRSPGPKRPQDRVLLSEVDDQFNAELEHDLQASTTTRASPVEGEEFDLGNGDVVIAAITSCTNTSNPSVLVAAGLVARKARAKGLTRKPWVKTSLAPGSQVVTDYLDASGLSEDLERASASTSSAMAAPPASAIRGRCPSRSARRSTTTTWSRVASCRATAISKAACRPTAAPIISPRRRWSSPMRSRARSAPTWSTSRSASAATASRSSSRTSGRPNEEVRALIDAHVHSRHVPHAATPTSITGDERWRAIEVTGGDTYGWPAASTYIQNPPYFTGMTMTPVPPGDIDRRAAAGGVRRFDHHRPHLAGRRDQARQPGRPLSARAQVVPRPSSTATARGAAIMK